MSKRTKVIVASIAAVVVCVGAGAIKLNDSAVAETVLTQEQKEVKLLIQGTYNVENQTAVKAELEQLKSSSVYTTDHMLVKQNPFGTNTLSLYVYFKTDMPVQVSYSIHVEQDGIADFTRELYDESEYTAEHENEIIGLVPDMENEITFTMTAQDGTSYQKAMQYTMGSLLGEEETILNKTEGSSSQQLEEGLYVVMGNDRV